ncbi:MAG: hypothetical protein U0X75_21685 [Acidobacteriota bacterium]
MNDFLFLYFRNGLLIAPAPVDAGCGGSKRDGIEGAARQYWTPSGESGKTDGAGDG